MSQCKDGIGKMLPICALDAIPRDRHSKPTAKDSVVGTIAHTHLWSITLRSRMLLSALVIPQHSLKPIRSGP